MPGTTNFTTFNPNCNNQETDAAYASDASRTNGLVFGQVFSSLLGNKLFYQQSIFVAAFAQMLKAKGYSPNDGSASPSTALTTLETVLANVITNADLTSTLAAYATLTGLVKSVSLGTDRVGSVEFGAALGNLKIQWGIAGPLPAGANNISLSGWANAPTVIVTPYQGLFNFYINGITTTYFIVYIDGASSVHIQWVAIGQGT